MTRSRRRRGRRPDRPSDGPRRSPRPWPALRPARAVKLAQQRGEGADPAEIGHASATGSAPSPATKSRSSGAIRADASRRRRGSRRPRRIGEGERPLRAVAQRLLRREPLQDRHALRGPAILVARAEAGEDKAARRVGEAAQMGERGDRIVEEHHAVARTSASKRRPSAGVQLEASPISKAARPCGALAGGGDQRLGQIEAGDPRVGPGVGEREAGRARAAADVEHRRRRAEAAAARFRAAPAGPARACGRSAAIPRPRPRRPGRAIRKHRSSRRPSPAHAGLELARRTASGRRRPFPRLMVTQTDRDPHARPHGFVVLMAALMASNALAIDVMLPALPRSARRSGWRSKRPAAGHHRLSAWLRRGAALHGPLADRFGRKNC